MENTKNTLFINVHATGSIVLRISYKRPIVSLGFSASSVKLIILSLISSPERILYMLSVILIDEYIRF